MKNNYAKPKLSYSPKLFFFYFISLFVVPLSILEIVCQFRFNTGYIYETITTKKDPKKIGLRPANTFYQKEYKKLYGNPTKVKKITYRTDKYGTIHPSTITNAKNNIKDATLFCGGSTTEASTIQEGLRPTDIFSKESGFYAINASMSGKDFKSCINTIEYFLKSFGKPRNIVLAINANTLMNFGRNLNSFEKEDNRNIIKKTLKKYFDIITPGLSQTRFHLIKQANGLELSNGEINYENRLAAGCCYGASQFNRKGSKLPFEWNNQIIQNTYKEEIKRYIFKLESLLKVNEISKKKIFFFIEPNSFLSNQTSSNTDFRQYLHNKNGIKVDGKNSAKWIQIYDGIFISTLKENKFNVLEINPKKIKGIYFYDAVHYSPEGGKFIGEFYAEKIGK